MTRVTVAHHGCPDYLMDIVSDGLIRLLGRENIHFSYNNAFPPDYIRARLYEKFREPNKFDFFDGEALILSTRSSAVLASEWIKKKSKKNSVVIVDGEDDTTIRNQFRELGSVYFKREVLGQAKLNIRPLPFGAFPEDFSEVERTNSVVFLGALRNSIRSQISSHLISVGLQGPQQTKSKDEYNRILASSKIGVSAMGAGWDTYRYWETAYFGCLLLSQNLPILIPGNFINGSEAVFFDGIEDFKKKLESILQNQWMIQHIAGNGRKACLERHLSVNRAKTVLEMALR